RSGMIGTRRGSVSKVVVALVVLLIVVVALFLSRSDVSVVPEPPKSATSPVELPATTSLLSVAISCPKTTIAERLDAAIPKSYQFDVDSSGARAFGNPGRGPINVAIDPAARRVAVSTSVAGRVQVEKTVIVKISVGIDVSGHIGASLSPEIAPNWTINPQF